MRPARRVEHGRIVGPFIRFTRSQTAKQSRGVPSGLIKRADLARRAPARAVHAQRREHLILHQRFIRAIRRLFEHEGGNDISGIGVQKRPPFGGGRLIEHDFSKAHAVRRHIPAFIGSKKVKHGQTAQIGGQAGPVMQEVRKGYGRVGGVHPHPREAFSQRGVPSTISAKRTRSAATSRLSSVPRK